MKKASERLMGKMSLKLFRNGSVLEFYGLKALITLEQVNSSVLKERRTLMSKT